MKRRKLTELEWDKVFSIRCRTKQGQTVSDADRALIEAAFREDPKRYRAREADVFDATVPFGSNARRRR